MSAVGDDAAAIHWVQPSTKANLTVRVGWNAFLAMVVLGVAEIVQQTTTQENDTPLGIVVFLQACGWLVGLFLLLALIVGSQGPRWSLLYRLRLQHFFTKRNNNTNNYKPRLYYRQQKVVPGYEAVVDAFVETLQEGRETGLQFAAFVNGELVVDLCGGTLMSMEEDAILANNAHGLSKEDETALLTCDNYSCVWSSSKVITSIVMAWLVDQGRLEYSDKIQKHWPEFTGGGKEHLTVAQVLKHAAGLHNIPTKPVQIQMKDMWPDNIINEGGMSKIIEGMECQFPRTGSKRLTYHGITQGWILNEIAHRVDVQHRTIGKILRDEFTIPLNIQDECFLGLPEELSDPSTNPKLRLLDPSPSILWVMCNKLCQWLCVPTTVQWGFPVVYTAFVTHRALYWTTPKAFVNPQKLTFYDITKSPGYFQGETPAANVLSSARALATIANALGSGNSSIFRNNVEKLVYEKILQNEETKNLMPGSKATFNDGGLCVMSLDKTIVPTVPGAPYSLGWFGFNGSLLGFHPKGDFAVAFQPTCYNELNPKARVYKMTEALMKCARNLHGEDWGAKI